MLSMVVLIRTFSSGIHKHPVSWNCANQLRMDLSDGGCFPNLVRNCRWTVVPRQSFLITLYFGFFICNSNKNIFHLIILIFHHFSTYSSPKFRYVLTRAPGFYNFCRQKSAYCVISNRVTNVSTSLSSLYLRSPRFCFSAGNSWKCRGDNLSWCNHSQFTVCTTITKAYAS